MPIDRHLISTKQLERSWTEQEIFAACERIRTGNAVSERLKGQSLYCLFYEPSFLTRTSFERAIGLMGGTAYHTEDASQFFPVQTPNFIDNIIGMLASLHIDLVVLRSSEEGAVDRAAEVDAVPIINGDNQVDHPTQALADVYTLHRELDGVDGAEIAVVGRLEHRNVSALLMGLTMFSDVSVTLIPLSGQADPDVVEYCQKRGLRLTTETYVEAVRSADAIYLNAPRTIAHAQLLRARGYMTVRIDAEFMSMLKPGCVILDPMQRSGDFPIEVQDDRLAFYRQAENALFVRMALLSHILGRQTSRSGHPAGTGAG